MARGCVSGIVADPVLLAAIRRFLKTKDVIEAAYLQALNAKRERLVEVVITSGGLEGGSASGQLAGDPAEMMAACEVALQEIDAEKHCGLAPSRDGGQFFNFSTRRVGT